jgi:hypothetical protein
MRALGAPRPREEVPRVEAGAALEACSSTWEAIWGRVTPTGPPRPRPRPRALADEDVKRGTVSTSPVSSRR